MSKHDPVPAGDIKPGNAIESLWRDLRYAVRSARESPLFVLFVVLTLALGIGANTTVFTMINTLILNPLPVPDSSGLAAVGVAKAKSPALSLRHAEERGLIAQSSVPLPLSYADLKDYQARNRVFRSLAGYTSPRRLTWKAGAASQGIFFLGRAAATVRLLTSGTELFGCNGVVRAQQGRSTTDPDPRATRDTCCRASDHG